MFRYDDIMRKVLDDLEMGKKLTAVNRMPIDEIKFDLAGFAAKIQGLDRALRERLFRVWYRKTKGTKGVPWIQGQISVLALMTSAKNPSTTVLRFKMTPRVVPDLFCCYIRLHSRGLGLLSPPTLTLVVQ